MQVKQTKTLEAVFAAGCREARRRHADEVTLDHLFLAILKQEGGHASHLLKRLLKEWELYQIKIRLERELGPVVLPDTPLNISCPDVRFDENALLEQMRMSGPCMVQDTCNTGHLLQVIVDDRSSRSSRILVLYNVTSEKIVSYLGDMPPNEDYYEDMQYLSLLGEENGEHPERLVSGVMRIAVTDGQPAAKDSMLGQFGVDLTNCAAEGKLDPVIGRDAEIERVIQILGRRKKNNPVLIGEAGVGKSAIIEGLALRITQKKVPHALLHKRIFSLDVASLVAGTKYRGQFEERINLLLKELSGSDVILFIDEIHTIVGAGSTQGSLDTANILKPALARGELQCIGATTLSEYRENIESDSALERRFQKIIVEQPSAEETLCMLNNIKKHYESHHCVHYTEAALEACVHLTQRYVPDRFFPDKAIDVMDEAGSRAHVFKVKTPEPLASMIARTGWEFGPDSRTAVVEMKSGHYNRHDHQHMDAGAFQIFYRAPLAVDIGVYGHWGGHYDFTFAKRTIPHNAMLVYDPEEKFAVPGNDGGQRFVRTMPWTIQQVIDHPEIHEAGRHVACYVGPDGDRPLFSYIKGDLASAYSPHKVQAYERSFVFSRLDRPETPALLVVYDHVTSTRPEYRKYFLLNTLTRPEFHGNTIRVENALPGGKPGELFVTTLLPESDNVEVTTSGDGKAMEFFREKVEMPPRNRMLSCGWRTMVSPKTPTCEDRFLHVMQIGEPSAAKYPVELLDSGAWLGVRAAGRIMTFAKSGKAGSAPVEFTVPAGEAHQVLLTDLLPGEYTVTRDGRPLRRVSVSKQAGTVAMAAEPGRYRVAPLK